MSREDEIGESRIGQRVAARLRDEIIAGKLRPGDSMPLEELARRFAVSTTPIREALAILERDDLVEGRSHAGSRVAVLDHRDLEDAYRLHAHVVRILTERATTLLTEDQLSELAAIDRRLRAAVVAEDRILAADLNFEFHRLIHRAARSKFLRRQLLRTTPLVSRRTDPQVPGWSAQALEHERLLAALRDREPKLAGKLAHRHILRSGDLVVAYLRSARDDIAPELEPYSHRPRHVLDTVASGESGTERSPNA